MILPLYILVRLNEVLLCGDPNSIVVYLHQFLKISILMKIDEHMPLLYITLNHQHHQIREFHNHYNRQATCNTSDR